MIKANAKIIQDIVTNVYGRILIDYVQKINDE